jgi:hypothetical protein
VEVIDVKVDEIEVLALIQHALHQKHMVRQRVDAIRRQAKRLLAYWHQTGFRERVATGEKCDFMTVPYEFLRQVRHDPLSSPIQLRRNAFI